MLVNNPAHGLKSPNLLIKSLIFFNAIIQFEQFKKCRFPPTNPLRFNIINKKWERFQRFKSDFDGDV